MLLSIALDALFPSSCAGCRLPGSAFCAACQPPLAAVTVRRDGSLRIIAGGGYEGALRRAILAYKRGRRDVGVALASWLADRMEWLEPSAVLIPVPTTRARRGERGFDQGELLARELGELRNRPVLLGLRHRAGDAQHGRTRSGRLAARERFACVAPQLIDGMHVVLVDDVVTTGATLADSAATLRRHGALVDAAVVLGSAPPARTQRRSIVALHRSASFRGLSERSD
ncbi:MAG: hypothetical protein M3R44_05870 [Candidatus Eremiobacteraeota bacterium]|nr:hypothetical protein [Candidatus Eremiobacteraeota bacterium]